MFLIVMTLILTTGYALTLFCISFTPTANQKRLLEDALFPQAPAKIEKVI